MTTETFQLVCIHPSISCHAKLIVFDNAFKFWFRYGWYGLIMHFCDSNHEITRSSMRKYNNIKDH